MSVRTPKYRLHKATGQALVQIDGRRIYLGKYGTPESEERYRRTVAEWLDGCLKPDESYSIAIRDHSLTVTELISGYFNFAKTYYVKNGKPTDELYGLMAAFRPLRSLYGGKVAARFGPKQLKVVRQAMIESDHSRRYINDNINRIRRMFKWAVENEVVSAHVYQALEAVGGLKKGRSAARETRPIQPVGDDRVDATLPHLPEIVADMVRFQRLTGCRPGEVCIIRPCDVDTSGDVWEYRPESHKTEHHGRERVVFIGPKAQDVLRPYLLREKTAYCFSPSDSVRKHHDRRREQRKSPMTPSRARRRRKTDRSRAPGDRYTKDSYRQSIQRACDRAFPPPEELSDTEIKKWRTSSCWSPNQLRHTVGTEIRRRFGLEAAQVTLGHASAQVTQIYAERDSLKAAAIMGEVG